MGVFIFRSSLILACIHWLNSQEHYNQFIPHSRHFKINQLSDSSAQEPSPKESAKNINTNKNVNVVLNVDSEKVAQRLWEIIKENLVQDSNKFSGITQQQLKQAITPLVSSTRRGLTKVPITEIGDKLEEITRRCLTIDDPGRSPVDREILTRNIVLDMMSAIKNVARKGKKLTEKNPARVMEKIDENSRKQSVDDDRYATFQIKVQQSDILKAIRSIMLRLRI